MKTSYSETCLNFLPKDRTSYFFKYSCNPPILRHFFIFLLNLGGQIDLLHLGEKCNLLRHALTTVVMAAAMYVVS